MTKALFMAAGLGSRISKEIDGLPKCLLVVNDEPLLLRNVSHLESKNIESTIAVGYQKEMVIETVKSTTAKIVVNEAYKTTNSIVSLELALRDLGEDEDLLILNADVCFDFKMLELVEVNESHTVFLSDSSRKADADYRFKWNENFEITEFGKHISIKETSGEYIGIAFIPGSLVSELRMCLTKYLVAGHLNKWWEEVILENPLLFKSRVKDFNGIFWSEFDYIEDYQRAIGYFKPV